jgi:purine-binding chemotaxis protein CheW
MSRQKTAPGTAIAANAAVAIAEAEGATGRTMQLVTFLLGDDEFGFHIDRVQEIIRYRTVRVTQIPNAPEMIEGVINLRGRLIPTVDLRKRFDRPAETTSRATRVVVVNVAGRTVGLIVDAVLEVAKVGTHTLEPLPEMASGVDSEFVEGVCRVDRGLVVVLDLERMFSEKETGAIQDLAE